MSDVRQYRSCYKITRDNRRRREDDDMATMIELYKEGSRLKNEAAKDKEAANLEQAAAKFEQAATKLQEAAALDPKSTLPLHALVQCLTELNRHEEAIATAQKIVQQEPDDMFAYISLSRAY